MQSGKNVVHGTVIDGVASELVVRFGHSVQGHPQAIEEVRRILREHLDEFEEAGSGADNTSDYSLGKRI